MTETDTANGRKFGPAEKEAWQIAMMSRGDLTPAQKNVLWALSTFANSDTARAWPSAAKVAERAGVKRRAAQTALQTGEDIGLLVTVEKGRTAATGANVASVRRLIVPVDSPAEGMVHDHAPYGAPSDVRMMHSHAGDDAHTRYPTLDRTSDGTSEGTCMSPDEAGGHVDSALPSSTEGKYRHDEPVDWSIGEMDLLGSKPTITAYLKTVTSDQDQATAESHYEWLYDAFVSACDWKRYCDWPKAFAGFAKRQLQESGDATPPAAAPETPAEPPKPQPDYMDRVNDLKSRRFANWRERQQKLNEGKDSHE